jgi:hypothetical protein
MDYSKAVGRLFSSRGLHNAKAQFAWHAAACKIAWSAPESTDYVAGGTDSEGDDGAASAGEHTDGEFNDEGGPSPAPSELGGDEGGAASPETPQNIELGRRQTPQSRGRLPAFSPSSFDSEKEASFESTRRSQMP